MISFVSHRVARCEPTLQNQWAFWTEINVQTLVRMSNFYSPMYRMALNKLHLRWVQCQSSTWDEVWAKRESSEFKSHLSGLWEVGKYVFDSLWISGPIPYQYGQLTLKKMFCQSNLKHHSGSTKETHLYPDTFVVNLLLVNADWDHKLTTNQWNWMFQSLDVDQVCRLHWLPHNVGLQSTYCVL